MRSGSQIRIVRADELEWVGAAGNYTELRSGGRTHVLRETMCALEDKLDPAHFLRIHRSRILRLAGIREHRSIENREYLLTLSDGSRHRSSRTYAPQLEQWLLSGHLR